jgi:hypothetical protein
MKKTWWRSKTLWVNALAGLAFVLQSQFGILLDPGVQGAILVVANLILRLVTKEAVGLQDEVPSGLGAFTGLDAGGPGTTGSQWNSRP